MSAPHDLPCATAREAAGLLARRALGLVLAADLRGHGGEDTDRGVGEDPRPSGSGTARGPSRIVRMRNALSFHAGSGADRA